MPSIIVIHERTGSGGGGSIPPRPYLSLERLPLGLESPDHDEGLQTRTAWPVRYASDGVADLWYLYGCFLLVNPRYRRAPLLTFGE